MLKLESIWQIVSMSYADREYVSNIPFLIIENKVPLSSIA